MIVKVFKLNEQKARIVNADKSIKIDVVLEETLRNKMNRRDRAFFMTGRTHDDQLTILNRLPDQKW
jgi:hypothetical protein